MTVLMQMEVRTVQSVSGFQNMFGALGNSIKVSVCVPSSNAYFDNVVDAVNMGSGGTSVDVLFLL